MPYGAPPNWYPPPGQGFPHGGPFPYGGYPPGPPGQHFPQQQKPAPIGVGTKQQAPGELSAEKPAEPKAATKPTTQVPVTTQVTAPTPPEVSKVASNEVKVTTNPSQPAAPAAAAPTAPTASKAAPKSAPTGPKNGRIMPAVPLPSSIPAKAPLEANSENTAKAPTAQVSVAANRAAIDDATQAATAAVAAAMAKLPPLGGQQTNGSAAVDNLTKKVKEMRTNDPARGTRQPGGGHRGRGRGGHSHEAAKFEVPAADFDFESSNAKFNKQDLVKEAIAGSPLAETPPSGPDDAANGSMLIPPSGSYNKKASFFDDLSSEIKDRADGADRPGGRVWRGEEQKKNLETFGQGSVDNGYRGGYRGRGRGRGGHRGRGYGGNGQPSMRGGRGGYRGGRGESQTVSH
jgi:protein LSM14